MSRIPCNEHARVCVTSLAGKATRSRGARIRIVEFPSFPRGN